MNQNVYGAEGIEVADAAPARTSVLATLSLVAGILSLILCCLPVIGPVVGLLGAAMGVGAIISIGASDGRLGGKAQASVGLITSVLGIVLGTVVLVGLLSAFGQLKQYGSVMAAAEAGDVSTAAPFFAPNTPEPLTAEALASFRDRYTAVMGAYRGSESGIIAVMKAASISMRLGSTVTASSERPIPVMGVFDRGPAAIVFFVDGQTGVGTLPAGSVLNIAVVPDQGNPIWLFDPGGVPAPAPAPPGGGP
jgi:hypothetical protein